MATFLRDPEVEEIEILRAFERWGMKCGMVPIAERLSAYADYEMMEPDDLPEARIYRLKPKD